VNKKSIIAAAIAAAVLVPTGLRAHQGHAHKVMGTVSSVDGDHVTVKTKDGKTVMVMLDAKTAVTRGKTKLDAAAIKVGERLVVEGTEEKNMMVAKTVKLGTVAAPAKK
jgi:hypothetical protein